MCVGQDDLRRLSQQIVFRDRVQFWLKMTQSPKQLTWCRPPVGCPDHTFLSFQFCVCLSVSLSALLHLPVLLPSSHSSITGRRGDPDFRLTGSRCTSLPRHIRNVHIRWLKGFFFLYLVGIPPWSHVSCNICSVLPALQVKTCLDCKCFGEELWKWDVSPQQCQCCWAVRSS